MTSPSQLRRFGRVMAPSLLLLALALASLVPLPACASSPINLCAVIPLSGPFAGAGFRSWLILNQSLVDLPTAVGIAGQADLVALAQSMQIKVLDSGSTVVGATRATLEFEETGDCAILMTGFEGLQNHNTTLLGTAAEAILAAGASSESAHGSDWHIEEGVSESLAIPAVVRLAFALPSQLPVIVPSVLGCRGHALADAADNFLPLCVPGSVLAETLQATFTAFGWKKFSLISQDAIDGSWNSRYADGAFESTSGLGQDGGGTSIQNQDGQVADAIMNEVYGNTTSVAKEASWPFGTLKSVVRYRIPPIPTLIPDAIATTLAAIQESRLFIIVVLLTGDTLGLFLQAAYTAGMLGKDSPYVWVGIGESARRGSHSDVIDGTGDFASGGRGAGLCSSLQATNIQTYQNTILTERLASGEITSTGSISASSTVSATISNVDNSVSQFATSNPLAGAFCIVPSSPTSTSWANLRHRLVAAGLPDGTSIDSNDAATYDTPFLLAYALRNVQSANAADPTSPTDGSAVSDALQKLNVVTAQSSYAFSYSAGGAPSRLAQADLINFEQLSSGSVAHFVCRARFNSATGEYVTIGNMPMIFATGTATIPLDYINTFTEGQRLTWSLNATAIILQIVMLLLVTSGVAMNVFKVRKWDPSDPDQRRKQWTALVRAATGYTSLVLFGNVLLGLSLLEIESTTASPGFNVPVFFLSWLFAFVLVMVGFSVAATQNGSKVAYFKSSRISRYEIAGKSGVAGGGGGSGVNFISSESSNNAESSGVAPIKQPAGTRAVPYRSARADNKGGMISHASVKAAVPLWSRALEELYITGVLCFTSWRMLFGGACLSGAHMLVFELNLQFRSLSSWIVQTRVPEADVGNSIILVAFHAYGLTVLFREARRVKQVFGVMWIVAVNVSMFFSLMSGMEYSYVTDGRAPRIAGVYWSPSQVALVLFILVAAALLTNLALVIDILQLSRGTLDQVLASAKKNLARLEDLAVDAKEATKSAKALAEYMRRLLELINLIRPLHRNHALAFALAEVADAGGVGGKAKRQAVIPPCFDQTDRVAGGSQGVPSPATGRSPMDAKRTIDQPTPTSSSRQPSNGHLDVTSGSHISQHISGDGAGTGAITPAGAVNPYSHLDFNFLACAKSEPSGLKLLVELSERLFLASGPVHHRAVADIQLAHVLAHPVALELFKDSLTRPGSQAHLAMWLDIQRWRGLGSNESRKTVAESMATTFLTQQSVAQSAAAAATVGGTFAGAAAGLHTLTNIKAATKDAIHRSLASGAQPALTLFDDIEGELTYQLQKEMQSFSGTTAFKIVALILGHAAYQPDARVAPLVRKAAQLARTDAQTILPTRTGKELSLAESNVSTAPGTAMQSTIGGNSMGPADHQFNNAVAMHLYADSGDEADSPGPLTGGGGSSAPSSGILQRRALDRPTTLHVPSATPSRTQVEMSPLGSPTRPLLRQASSTAVNSVATTPTAATAAAAASVAANADGLGATPSEAVSVAAPVVSPSSSSASASPGASPPPISRTTPRPVSPVTNSPGAPTSPDTDGNGPPANITPPPIQ